MFRGILISMKNYKTLEEIGDLGLYYLVKRDEEGKIVYQEAYLTYPTQQEKDLFELEYFQLNQEY